MISLYVDNDSPEASRVGVGAMQGDSAYFAERAKQERAAAMRASSRQAREAHLEMAKRYDQLADSRVAHEPGPQAAAS